MKLNCPKCNAAVNIGGASRIQMFHCPQCRDSFFGLDAEVTWGSLIFGSHMQTPCPQCGQVTRLMHNSGRGYRCPARCCWCTASLERPQVYKDDYSEIVDLARQCCMSREKANEIMHHVRTNKDLFLTDQQRTEIKRLLDLAVARHGGN